MRRRFESDRRTPIRTIKKELVAARKEKLGIYLIARVIGTLRGRNTSDVILTSNEERELWQAFGQARVGKKPLGKGLPRGYQIARFAMTIKVLYPEASVDLNERDMHFVRRAFRYYQDIGEKWSDAQIQSLTGTLKYLGVKI